MYQPSLKISAAADTGAETTCSVHPADELIDKILAVSPVAAALLCKTMALAHHTTARICELEWPKEIGDLFEVGADGVNLVGDILHSVHAAFLAHGGGNDLVA